MNKTQKHHGSQKAIQKASFGKVVDDTTIELPTAYHQKEINPLQQKGVGDAYLAGKIDHDSMIGKIDDYKE
jgi:hypothetical protein